MHTQPDTRRRHDRRVAAAEGPPPIGLTPTRRLALAVALAALACFAIGLAAGSAGAQTVTPLANPAADLDQCANDPSPSPPSTGCDGSPGEQGWQNGNIVSSQALYYEGDSVPYRMTFSNLATTGSHTVVIEWDTTQGGKHAIDYLTSWNRTVTTAKPCLGVSGCSGSPSTFAIPADPQVTGAGVTPVAGSFALWGGTITGVSAYSGGAAFPTGNNTRQIAITFTAAVANPVLAWGGHISTREDWGMDGSAVAISGSPYHTRLISLDGAGGNQDRALQAAAVVFPGSITIVKDAAPEGSTAFAFTASPAPLAAFQLVDDGTASNTKAVKLITDFTTYTVAETAPGDGWTLKGVKCSVTGGVSTTPPSTTTNTVAIALKEGDNVTCTFANERTAPQLIVIKDVVNDNGGTAKPGDFTLDAGGTGDTPDDFPGASSPGTTVTLEPGPYDVTEQGPTGYAATFSKDCAGTIAYGEVRTCTVTNDDIAPVLKLRKVVVNDDGGTAVAGDFELMADGTDGNDLSGTSPVDSGPGLIADTWALSETGPNGYAGSWSCEGGTPNGDMAAVDAEPASITLGIGEEATCTATNDDIGAQLIVIKEVVNGQGGSAGPADFTLASNGVDAVPATFPGASAPGTAVALDPGPYDVSETGPAGYRAAYSEDCAGTIALGETRTCTVTNTRLGTITVAKALSPATDAGLFDLSIDGTVLAAGVGDGGTTGAQPLEPGDHVVAEAGAAGTALAGYTSALSCTDATGVILTASPATSATVALVDGQDVVCTFANTAIPSTTPVAPAAVVAPPTAILPPKAVRGRAALRGPSGCVGTGTVFTRVSVRNAKSVYFYRDGRLAKRVVTGTAAHRTYTLGTAIRPGDYSLHRVEVRVRYVTGARPATKVMAHRFGQCRASSVTG